MKHKGNATVKFSAPPTILSTASIVGSKEGEGPIGPFFDKISEDIFFGKETWEQAESELSRQTIELAVQKAKIKIEDVNYIFAGDLLNQISGSTFGVRSFSRPFFGLFGACSAIGSGMSLAAMLIDGGFAEYAVASASSHFCGTEKTFRFPIELGTQRPPTSGWTVTGDGAVVLAKNGNGPYITAATTGAVVDMGVTDANCMGAAMAPAAAEVITTHFSDLSLPPNYYDMIVTGDLGHVGSTLLRQLMKQNKFENFEQIHEDCGLLIFDRETQDVDSGGSGCGCAAATFAGYLYNQLQKGLLKRILFVPTGALHSVATIQQGESIPAIAHAVAVEI